MAMILSFAASIQAAEVTETIAMKKFGGLSTSSYENVTKTGTSDLGTEMVAYAFNPTTGQVRGNKTAIAGASVTSKDDSKNWSLYNTQPMAGAIKSIKVTQTATGSNKFQNNMYVALGTTNQGAVTTVNGAQKNTTGTTTEFTFDIDETQGYTYFKLLSNVKFTSGSVAGVVVTVTYVTGNEDPDATMYTVTTKVNDETMGTVTGAGEYAEGKTATLTANPNTGYKFVNWSNGETANPLKLTVTENVEITANFAVIPPMTCAEAAATASGETVVLNPFDVVYVVKDAGYIYIKDESGFNLIYDFNLDDKLKAGDHVEGFVGVSSPYNGLPELKASVSYNELTVTSGVAPEPTVMAAAPTKAELNQYVKFENVTLTANTTFSTSSATNATMVVNGTNVTLRNNFKLAATLSKDKAYNIVGFVAIYNSTIQVYYLSAEEYVAPEPCTLATAINWDDAINAEANTDKWYAVNIASAIAAKKDIALTVANPGAAAVEVTVEAYANCPATEKIAGATSTINAGATKTTTVKYDEYLADQVEVVYLHVVTSGDLTVDAEVIEPCTQATAINWDAPIAAAANIDAWYAVNVESAIAAGKDLALTVSNPSTEAVEVSIEAYANCPATEKIAGATSTIEAGATKTTTVKYDEYLADQVKVVYMHVTTKGGEIKVEAETVKFNVTATAENGTVEGAGIYEQGAEATLTATPAEGYEFVNWTSGETVVSTENPYKFTVTADVALVANFEKAAPATETVYFVNAANWTKVNAYAWDPVQNANWPGAAATKEAEQIAGYDVYSYTAEVGKYKNVIFNNGSGQQTADLQWTAGKYYVKDGWYTKEEAEAKLAKPVEYESVYFVNVQAWNKVNIYTWTPEVGGWPGVGMTKEAEQLAGYDVYSYKVEKGTSFGGMLFNCGGDECKTGDLQWTAGKYYVKDGWYTKEEAEAKLAGPVTPPVITYVLMGVKGDWTTGIEMTINPDNANEYVLLGQDIAEGDAVKVVTLTDGTATAWCGNVDEYSVAHSADDMGNIVLAPGKYDFYYKVAEDLIYIGAVEPTVEVMELTMTNLQVSNYGDATGLWASDTDNGIEVMLFLDAEGNLMAESSIMVGWMDYNVTGTVTKAYNEELATDVYTAELYTTVGETNYKLIITMYSAPVEATVVVVENAEIDDQTEETGFMYMTGVWTDAEGVVYPVKAEVPGFDITVAEAVYKNVTVTIGGMGDEDPWLGFVQGDATITVVENVVTLTGVMSSWDGLTLDVTITGTLPVVEPEKPEPTYTDNNLNPYAFGLESKLSADKSTLTMTYRLNNSKATDVDVVVKGGDEVIIIVNGTTNIGKNTVEISTEGFPGGVDITWSVIVKGTSVAAPTREEKIYSFYHPSGLDIDNNPENKTFGMLLVNEGMHSVKSKTEGYVSAQFGAGIFAFTPSFDLIPNGELPGYNGGIEFTNTRADGTGTAYAPRRIRISEDGRIFVTSLNTDGNYLWEVNPENMNEWTSVFKGTLNDQRELITEDSAFIAAPNNGFDVKGSGENLQLAMYSVNLSGITAAVMSGFRLHEYNLGTATEWATAPSKALVEGKYAINYTGTQVEYDNEGGFWIASYRGSATDANPGLVHINAEGVEDCKLVWNNVRQAGIRFNKDFTKLVVAGNNGAAKKATIYTISKDANGAPVLTQETVIDMSVVGNNLNDFAWDYAGNLYACGNSSEKLAAWAMPYSGEVETPAASKYAFQLEGTGSDYEMYEDVITNLVIDYDNLLLIGGPSEAFQVEVVLGLGDYDRNTDAYQLLPASTISVLGSEAQFIDGYASVDGIEQSATAVVHCTWNGMAIEFHLTMTAAPLEATKVVVENAAIEIEKYLLWGDMYDYSLKMTGVWTNEGVDYPVLVEVPVYYPEATEPYEIYSTVTVGGMGDDDPWLGFGEGYLTITPEGNTITATGIVENPMAGIAIDITISGNINNPGLALDNATVVIKSIKKIQNGQLIIEKDGVQYNAQGATLK